MKQWELRRVTLPLATVNLGVDEGQLPHCPVCNSANAVAEIQPLSIVGACADCGSTWVQDGDRTVDIHTPAI